MPNTWSCQIFNHTKNSQSNEKQLKEYTEVLDECFFNFDLSNQEKEIEQKLILARERLKEKLNQKIQLNRYQTAPWITGRAFYQSLNTWGALTTEQLVRGLKLNKNGQRSMSGYLGGLKPSSIATKLDSGAWMIIDYQKLAKKSKYFGFREQLFPPEGIQAMKERAKRLSLENSRCSAKPS